MDVYCTYFDHCVHCAQWTSNERTLCVMCPLRPLSLLNVYCAQWTFNVSIVSIVFITLIMLIGCNQPKRNLQQIDVKRVCLLWTIKWTQWTSILSIGHVHWSPIMNTLCLLCPLVTNGHFQHFGTWPMDGSMDAHWTFIGHGHCTQCDECTQWAPPTVLVALLPKSDLCGWTGTVFWGRIISLKFPGKR